MATEPSITFWSIFRSLLRPPQATESQVANAIAAGKWLDANFAALARALVTDEAKALGPLWDHYRAHQSPPTYAILRHVVDGSKDAGLQYSYSEYEKIAADLTIHDAADLDELLRIKSEERREERVLLLLRTASAIVTEGLEVRPHGRRDKVHRKGAEDALTHLREGIAVIPDASGYVPPVTSSTLGDEVSIACMEALLDTPAAPRIPTGVACIDQFIHARRGQFVGVLGYAGAGKTRLCRTWAYHAATLGHHVLHISLEQSHNEELPAYAVIHAHAAFGEEARACGLTSAAQAAGRLTPAAGQLMLRALRDFSRSAQTLTVKQATEHTWDAVLAYIDAETRARGPVDMVVIDYLTAVEHDPIHAQQAMGAIIAAAKRLAQSYHRGRGMLVVSPVQANRSGKNEAKASDGCYDLSSVAMFSSIDKFADSVISVYGDKDLAAQHRLKISTAKHRHGAPMPPHEVAVHTPTQTLVDLRPAVTEAALSDLLADL